LIHFRRTEFLGMSFIARATDAETGAVPGRVMKHRSSSLTAPTTGTPAATMRAVIACMAMTLSIIW